MRKLENRNKTLAAVLYNVYGYSRAVYVTRPTASLLPLPCHTHKHRKEWHLWSYCLNISTHTHNKVLDFNKVELRNVTSQHKKRPGCAGPVGEWSARWATMPATVGLIPRRTVGVLAAGQRMSPLLPSFRMSSPLIMFYLSL